MKNRLFSIEKICGGEPACSPRELKNLYSLNHSVFNLNFKLTTPPFGHPSTGGKFLTPSFAALTSISDALSIFISKNPRFKNRGAFKLN